MKIWKKNWNFGEKIGNFENIGRFGKNLETLKIGNKKMDNRFNISKLLP